MKKRFADLEQVADFVAEWIDSLGLCADDFDCGGIAMAVATLEDDDPDGHWLVDVNERSFSKVAACY